MRKLQLLLLLTFLYIAASGQLINYTPPPAVVNDISKTDYKTIVDLTIPVIKKRYTIESVNEGTILLAKDQDMKGFNLDNLVLKCVAVKDKNLWKQVILEHFTQLFSSIDEKKKIDPGNFETVRKYLSIRIYPKEWVMERGGIETMVFKSDLEGTYTILMLDLPGAFTNVDKDMFSLWKKDSTEVFSIAQSNINKQPVEKVTQTFNIDGSNIEVHLIGDENYAASYALDLANNSPEFIGEWGAAIAIPNKGLVDLCKISKDKPVDFVKFIQRTKPMTERSFTEHPQPVSNQYFWYYKGKFTKIEVLTDSKGKLNIIAPLALSALMTAKE